MSENTISILDGSTFLVCSPNGDIDAAIAANAALAVLEPMQCGLGGDLFVIHREAATGELTGLNASGPAPRALSP